MLKRNVAVVLAAAVVLGGGAAASAGGASDRPTVVTAQADTPPSSQAPADRRAARQALRACLERAGEDRDARRRCAEEAGPRLRHGLEHARRGDVPLGSVPLGRAVHGTALVPDGGGGWHEVTFDRGTVDESTDGSAVVLDRPDGATVTIALTGDTRYSGVADAAGLVDGRAALVVSKDGKALHVAQKRRAGNNNGARGVQRD